MTGASLMHEATHSKPVLWDNQEGWGGRDGGRGVQDWGHTCVPTADRCLCMAKNLVILYSNRSPIKIN